MHTNNFFRGTALGVAAAAFFLVPEGVPGQGGPNASWTVEADTALENGVPALEVSLPDGHRLPHAAVTDLHQKEQEPRAVAPQYLGAGGFRFEFPRVDKLSYLAMTLTDPADGEEVFRWQSVRLSEGKRLRDHRGRQEMLPPEDFDAFWAAAKEELAAVPMEPRVTMVEGQYTETGQLLRVELQSVRDTTIVCWMMVPREAAAAVLGEAPPPREYPAVIVMPGYGAEQPPLDRTADGLVTLSVNPRNHGPSRDYWTAPVEHLRYNIESPEDFYYRLAFLDCLRAAEFLFDQPIVDPRRVAAEGGSQGGLFAIALGMLEPRIAVVVSNVTAFANYPEGMLLATAGHQTGYRSILDEAEAAGDTDKMAAVRRSLALTDAVNLVTRLTQPLQVNMGGLDPVCPYVSGIVIVNRAPGDLPTEFNIFPNARHEVPGDMRRKNAEWVTRWLELEEVPSFPGAIVSSPWSP